MSEFGQIFSLNNIILIIFFCIIFQRVYGVTTATVRVGYEYRDCGNSLDGLVWHIETTRMSGHDLASTDIGGWNLHVQHKYNFHSGILQKGDGNTIYLKYKPQVCKFLGSQKLTYFTVGQQI